MRWSFSIAQFGPEHIFVDILNYENHLRRSKAAACDGNTLSNICFPPSPALTVPLSGLVIVLQPRHGHFLTSLIHLGEWTLQLTNGSIPLQVP